MVVVVDMMIEGVTDLGAEAQDTDHIPQAPRQEVQNTDLIHQALQGTLDAVEADHLVVNQNSIAGQEVHLMRERKVLIPGTQDQEVLCLEGEKETIMMMLNNDLQAPFC